ncbi:mitochondrial inner membrane protein OXA1L-like [Lycorma delicatula]|uniref:mitochondrial inner membrane protein OXA1L-like n=1 Tax=Lycorma delicatula TaxID=130591 RepID=UPI003F517EE0
MSSFRCMFKVINRIRTEKGLLNSSLQTSSVIGTAVFHTNAEHYYNSVYSKHFHDVKSHLPVSNVLFINNNNNFNEILSKQHCYLNKQCLNNVNIRVINRIPLFSSHNSYRQFSISLANYNNDVSVDASLSSSQVTLTASVVNPSATSDITNSETSYIEYNGTLQSDTVSSGNVTLIEEPSFESIGLGGWSPPGLVQSAMEFLHISYSLPWWACVVCGTLIIRIAVLPLVIRFQRQMIVMNNTLPQMQVLQMKMMNARQSGNPVEAAHYSNELVNLVQTKQINPFKSIALPLIQLPFFLSFFFGLRGMTELPVESLHNGGLWWFSDLTVPDPYYILPIATCLTLLITIELGLDSGVSVNQVQIRFVKYVMRAMPIIMFPVIMNFPGIILVYWLSNNLISLIQSNVLKITSVRDFCGFEHSIKNTASLDLMKKMQNDIGFKQGFKDSLENMKISQEMMERMALEREEKIKKLKGELKKKHNK